MATLRAAFTITDYFMNHLNDDIYLCRDTWGRGAIWREEDGSYTFDFDAAGDHLTLEELSQRLSEEQPFMARCVSEMNLDGHKYHGAMIIMTVLKALMYRKEEE